LNEFQILSEKLDELIFWAKFSALPTLRILLKDVLRDDVDKLVYEFSDGKRSTREVAMMISERGRKITHVSVANMWHRWLLLNLVIPTERSGRYKRAVSLKSIGMEVPALEAPSKGEENGSHE